MDSRPLARRLALTTALSASAMGLVIAGSAYAANVEVNNTVEEPLTTSAPDDVSPGDITITSNGKVVVDSGPAVTIDSNNAVTLEGKIEVSNPTDAVGVRILGGNTGSFLSTGTIELQSAATDDNPRGTGKTGIELVGPGAFTGNVELDTTSGLRVNSDGGTGVALRTQMIGDFLGNGQISVNGEGTTGVLVDAPIIGSLDLRSAQVAVSGAQSAGVDIRGDISGGFRNLGRVATISLYEGYTFEEGDPLPESRGGVLVGGSIGEGFLNDGRDPLDTENTPSGGGVIDAKIAPYAVQVSPDIADGLNGNIVLGHVGEDHEAYGLINRGTITIQGIDKDQQVTALDIRGSADLSNTATIETGIRNTGSITAAAEDADFARGIAIGRGGTADEINNSGSITASMTGNVGGNAHALLIEEGGKTTSIINTGTISAQASGVNANAFGIEDRSSTLSSIVNRGRIAAGLNQQSGVTMADGAMANSINLSASSRDVTIINEQYIVGDVRLGSGDDLVHLTSFFNPDSDSEVVQNSFLLGSIYSGGGNDTVILDGGAELAGGIFNQGGTVDLQVMDGRLGIAANSNLQVTSALFGAESTTTIFLDQNSANSPRISVAGLAQVEEGAVFDLRFREFLGSSAEITLIDAGTLVNNADLFGGELFFLYNGEVKVSDLDPSDIVLTLDLKDADQLGLDSRQAKSYGAFVEVLDLDAKLASAIGNLSDSAAFLSAYDQLLPTGGLAARSAAIAVSDQTAFALGGRLDSLRRLSHDQKSTAWFQLFGSYYEQDQVADYVGFTGETYGIAGGFDYAALGADALGLSFSWAGSTIADDGAFEEEDLRVDTLQLGAYGSWSVGPAFLQLHGAGGYNRYRTDRYVIIGDDFSRTPKADWDGYQYAGSVRTGLDGKFGNFRITPTAGIDYLYVNQNGFAEAGGGDGINLQVAESDFTSLRASGELELAYSFKQSNGSTLTPSLRGGIRQEFETDPLVTEARFKNGSEVFEIISGEIPESGVLGGLGIAYDMNSYYGGLHLEAGYTGLVEEDFIRHSGGINFRFTF